MERRRMRICTMCREAKGTDYIKDSIYGCVEHVLEGQIVVKRARDRDATVNDNRYIHRYCIHKVNEEKYEFCFFFSTCIWRRVPTSQRLMTEGFCWEHIEEKLKANAEKRKNS